MHKDSISLSVELLSYVNNAGKQKCGQQMHYDKAFKLLFLVFLQHIAHSVGAVQVYRDGRKTVRTFLHLRQTNLSLSSHFGNSKSVRIFCNSRQQNL